MVLIEIEIGAALSLSDIARGITGKFIYVCEHHWSSGVDERLNVFNTEEDLISSITIHMLDYYESHILWNKPIEDFTGGYSGYKFVDLHANNHTSTQTYSLYGFEEHYVKKIIKKILERFEKMRLEELDDKDNLIKSSSEDDDN